MMNRAVVVLVLGVLSGCFGLHGNGDRVTERRRTSEFTEIENNTSLDVEIAQGEAFEVRVRIDSNLQKFVDTRVVGETLVIESDAWFSHLAPGPHVFVTMPRIERIHNDGSGDVFAAWFEQDEDVRLELTGSGDLTFEGSVPRISAEVDGSGDLHLTGTTELAELTNDGSGDIDASELTAARATVSVEGSGDLHLRVDGRVDARIDGSGDVELSGAVKRGNFSEHGSGRIHVN